MFAFAVPSSSFSTSVPAVAVYFTSCPPIRAACFVRTVLSSGGFFSSFGFSAVLSAGFSAAGCCASATPIPIENNNAVNTIRNRLDIVKKPSRKFSVGIAPAKSYSTPPSASIQLRVDAVAIQAKQILRVDKDREKSLQGRSDKTAGLPRKRPTSSARPTLAILASPHLSASRDLPSIGL